MTDEQNQPDEEVEGHLRHRGGLQEDDPGKRFDRAEESDDDEVEAHLRHRGGQAEDPGKRF